MFYTVYHVTNKEFRRFSLKTATQGIIWFTDSIESIKKGETGAALKGKERIIKCEIELNNPAGWNEYEKYGIGQLKGLKYDGVILPMNDIENDYIVFNTKQIKKMKTLKESKIPEIKKLVEQIENLSGKKVFFKEAEIKESLAKIKPALQKIKTLGWEVTGVTASKDFKNQWRVRVNYTGRIQVETLTDLEKITGAYISFVAIAGGLELMFDFV